MGGAAATTPTSNRTTAPTTNSGDDRRRTDDFRPNDDDGQKKRRIHFRTASRRQLHFLMKDQNDYASNLVIGELHTTLEHGPSAIHSAVFDRYSPFF